MPDRFFWYDLMTSDTKAAEAFYADVVGWQAADSGTPGYTLLTTQGLGVAGLMPVPEEAAKAGARPAWMGYILVEDVDAMAAAIQKEGGRIMRGPFDVPGVIRIAVAADPQGAGFLIAQPMPKEPVTWPAPGTPGTVGWHELYAGDQKTVFPFYQALFGWTKADALDMGPMGTYQLFAAGGEAIGAMMTRPPQIPVPFWNYYFNVPSVGAAKDAIAARGGRVVMGPHEVPGGQWILQGFDPQSAFFSLVSPAP